jgi:O-antigen/teichoic acid export membrane protein
MAIPSAADSAALARGGRVNFVGFLLRLMARLPFLVIAGRLYGAEDLGRFAYATMVVELAAAVAVVGLRRGLAAELASHREPETHVIADALLLSTLLAAVAAGVLIAAPALMFPGGAGAAFEPLFALIIFAIVLSDVSLAAMAFRHRIDVQVRARSLIEPWVLTIAAVTLTVTPLKGNGLLIAYIVSLIAACAASLIPTVRLFGRAEGWRPSLRRMAAIAARNLPLAGADIIEWATRRVDIFILGRFAPPETVGVYFVAQQVATLAGKVRSSFDPILAPMLAGALVRGERALAAAHVRQVGFWVLAFQLPIVLALGLPGEGVLGLFGAAFAVGGLVLALLLVTELVAASASLSEMALIYARPRANLAISALGIGVQAGLCLLLVPRFGAEGAALGLLLSLMLVAFAKQMLLAHDLEAPVALWRWSLLTAAVPTFAFGYGARQLPELPQMLVTIPGTLLLFGILIWPIGFKPADRMLFRKGAASEQGRG